MACGEKTVFFQMDLSGGVVVGKHRDHHISGLGELAGCPCYLRARLGGDARRFGRAAIPQCEVETCSRHVLGHRGTHSPQAGEADLHTKVIPPSIMTICPVM